MFSPSEDKIIAVYASLKMDIKIEDNGKLKKYIGIELDHHLKVSIHLHNPFLTQSIINLILGMDK